MISLKSLFTLQFSLQRQTPLMDMASHSRLLLPFSLFLISSVFISSVSDSQFFTCSLKPSQTLTISHSIKSKPFPQIQSSKLLFLQNPNPNSKEQTLAASDASNAVTQSPLHLQRLAPPPLSTPLSIATAGVLIPCTLHLVSKVIFLCFSSFFFVNLVGFICDGNQMFKSNKSKDSYYETLTKKNLETLTILLLFCVLFFNQF